MKSRFTFILCLAPAMLAAQAATTATGSASASAAAKAGRTSASTSAQTSASAAASTEIPQSYSAESRAKLDATFSAARERNLPEEPIRDRIAEGRAKGASEAQVVLAAQRTEARLEAAQRAMIRGGRREPRQDEVSRGEQAIVRRATEAQIELITRRAPAERSLVVAFDVLTQLQARGVSSERAVAQIASRLEANASDRSIGELAASANAGGSAAAAGPANANVGAAGSTAASVAKTGGVVAGATAGVGAVIKPPVDQ